MPIVLAFIIVAVSSVAITYKTYTGYVDYRLPAKIGFLLFLILGWCAPLLAFAIRHKYSTGWQVNLTEGLYFFFGFVFFLFVITLTRDILWVLFDLIRRAPMEEMKNPVVLKKVNIFTFIFCFLFCLYGIYEAKKDAPVKTYDITSPKVKKETKIIMLSDLHIDVNVPVSYVKNLVERVNALNPDAIVLVGDVIDNSSYNLYSQMEELQKLKAKDGVYVTLGNHEFYAGVFDWIIKFGKMQYTILNNMGTKLDDTGIYLAGIPDINAAQSSNVKINLPQTLRQATKDDFVIMLSHTPKIIEGMDKDKIDLMLSGHTHGGQIFPFHYFVMQANQGRLAGFYNDNGIKMYISRGTRYWGPPMRVFAPSEIAVFNLKPEKNV